MDITANAKFSFDFGVSLKTHSADLFSALAFDSTALISKRASKPSFAPSFEIRYGLIKDSKLTAQSSVVVAAAPMFVGRTLESTVAAFSSGLNDALRRAQAAGAASLAGLTVQPFANNKSGVLFRAKHTALRGFSIIARNPDAFLLGFNNIKPVAVPGYVGLVKNLVVNGAE